MPDQPVREIQLGGKQLVFLFMAAVVLAVAVFLLGISVGRGVRGTTESAATSTEVNVAADAPAAAPSVMPPPTETTPADLKYHDQLQGQKSPAGQMSAAPPPASPAVEPPTPVGDLPAAQTPVAAATKSPAAPVTKSAAPSAEKAVEKPAAKEPAITKSTPVPAAGGWYVQVDSFRSKDNADRQAAHLKSKNYAVAVSQAAGLFRVRVGPFAQRDEADRVRQRLQREEGLKPSIQR